MNKRLKKHISHVAKSAGVPVRDAWNAWENKIILCSTIKDGVNNIRWRSKCTVKAARQRYDAALGVVDKVVKERWIGKRRRDVAKPKPIQTIQERKVSIILLLIGFRMPGSHYSGDTVWEVDAVTRKEVCAYTRLSEGDQYSKSCWYSKTDAAHHLNICLGDLIAARRTNVPASIDGELVIRAQQIRDGIYELTTIRNKGKSIKSKTRFAADQGVGQWFLGNTERGAVVALNRAKRQIEIVRLGKINAKTCRDWGWCSTGIIQWCAEHGIRRDLKTRLRSGTKAKAIARLIVKHGGPRTSYERRLIEVAS